MEIEIFPFKIQGTMSKLNSSLLKSQGQEHNQKEIPSF